MTEIGRRLDVAAIRKDFPILERTVHGYPLVYLDNAATTQKPKVVLDAMDEYYRTINANVHRGVHYLSQQATEACEGARGVVAEFIHARHVHEVIFTRGTTESINLVAASFGKRFLRPGDSILVSGLEHHSNIVPWQMICEEKQARLRVIPIDDQGELVLDGLENMLADGVKLVAVNYVSNALGSINPVREDHCRGAPAWYSGVAGCRAGGAASRGGCTGAGCGLPGVLQPIRYTDPPGYRGVIWKRGVAEQAAALSGRAR